MPCASLVVQFFSLLFYCFVLVLGVVMYSMRRVRSEGAGPTVEDENTDEVNRRQMIEPYLMRLCRENNPARAVDTGTSSDTPLLDELGMDFGPKAEPTFTSKIYDEHVEQLDTTQLELSGHGQSVERIQDVWATHREQYEAVANQVDLPPELIAALHYQGKFVQFRNLSAPR